MHSCGGASDAAKVLKNEKVTNTDEFLVKKRAPLVLPPEYDTLPEPNSAKNSKKTETNKINKIYAYLAFLGIALFFAIIIYL